MRFGIYCEIQTPPGKSHYGMIWEIMRQIEHADECGFDVYATIDHHFFQNFSISANPLAMFAAAAQPTNRIRLRTALHTLPLKKPMRLPGMIAEIPLGSALAIAGSALVIAAMGATAVGFMRGNAT
ncbi:MAG: LLM class flavin-dependent oxidoreductase [Terriglobales bacterium]